MITKSIASIFTIAIIATIVAGSALTTRVFADSNCTTQYGGTQYGSNCVPNDLLINKEVKHPVQRTWVENIGSNDVTYVPGSDVQYRLTIKNASGQTFDPIEVRDVFPPYVTYVSGGPSGTSWDLVTRTLTFKLDKMIAGETRQIELNAKVAAANVFPSGQNVFCVVNTGEAKAEGRDSQDTAQICIRTNVLGTTTLPKAGFNDLLLLIPFTGIGFAGMTLLKKRNG